MGSPARPDARRSTRRLDLHQRDEPVDLGLLRDELGEDAAEAERVLAEGGPHPVVAGGRRVALVEDQVDDLEHRREPRGERVAARDLEGHARLGERPLGPHDALRDRRLRDEERARDLLGRQAAEQAQRERDARLGREDRVARGEDEAQQVVADVVVHRGLGVGHGPAVGLEAVARAPRAFAPRSCRGAGRRARGSSPWPSATRPGCPGRPTPATARARRRARPARAPRRDRRRAPCARGPR